MRASIGGIVNLFLITLFIVIISSLLLFNVSYAKAFRVKNKIITTYEQYEGNCSNQTACQAEIKSYEDRLGYNVTRELKPEDPNEKCYQSLGYCALVSYNPLGKAYTYKIRTEVKIRFPFIDDIFGIGSFKVSGKTHAIVR